MKKDIENYYKAQKIASEVKDIVEGKNTETDNIENFLEKNEYAVDVLDHVFNSTPNGEYSRREKYHGATQLILLLKKQKQKRRFKRILYSFVSTAAVVAIIVFLVYNQDPVSQSIVAETPISVPTLTLADGTRINLEDNVALLSNDSVVTKLNRNTIALKKDAISTYNTITVPAKYVYTIILSDSSEVTLNAGSEFRYATNFEGDTRGVFLKGEGYFKVRKGDKPFVVTTGEISVKVYGTEFNVNTNLPNTVETVLVSGRVGVTVNQSGDETMMLPNELFRLHLISGISNIESANLKVTLDWLSDRFVSDEESLGELLSKIGRWYNIEFVFANREVADRPIVANLKRSTNLNSILTVLEKANNVKFIKENADKYVVE